MQQATARVEDVNDTSGGARSEERIIRIPSEKPTVRSCVGGRSPERDGLCKIIARREQAEIVVAPKRKGQLVVCVRETIGWKYLGKPAKPKPGEAEGAGEKPSAARKIGGARAARGGHLNSTCLSRLSFLALALTLLIVCISPPDPTAVLVREFFVDKKLNEPKPAAPGFKAQWELHKLRGAAGGG